MKLRIGHKLFLVMLITTGIGIAFMVLAQRYTFERGLLNYAQQVEIERLEVLGEELADRYADEGGWSFIAGSERWPHDLVRLGRGARPTMQDGALLLRSREGKAQDEHSRPSRERRDLSASPVRPLWARISLVDTNDQWVAGAAVSDVANRREIMVNGAVAGYLVLAPLGALSDELDLEFARQQVKEVLWAGVVVLVGAAIASAVLARGLGLPIRALARGTHALAGGHYETRLELSRNDELGRLAGDFNRLAQALEQSRDARQQWVADIAHELRTPIAVLQAELEALEDGLRPLDHKALNSLSAEVMRLRALIADLHQLAQADAGTLILAPTSVDVAVLLEETIDRFRERLAAKELTIEIDLCDQRPIIADADRLRQLFANLVENALRYTDPDGTVRITSKIVEQQVQITVEDSPPCVPEEALAQLFDRLYRVDPSRSRETGASGLGLAICQSIVEAHSGSIRARYSQLGGLAIDVELPLQFSGA